MVFFVDNMPFDKSKIDTLPLEELLQMRLAYVESIEKRTTHLQLTEKQLQELKQQLENEKNALTILKGQNQIAEMDEAMRLQNLKDAMEDQSPDNYACRMYYLNFSPLQAYRDNCLAHEKRIIELQKRIASLQCPHLEESRINKTYIKRLAYIEESIAVKDNKKQELSFS